MTTARRFASPLIGALEQIAKGSNPFFIANLNHRAFRMGDVIHATFTPKITDGGKARILARRYAINLSEPVFDWRFGDLTMDHADPCNMLSDSAYPGSP